MSRKQFSGGISRTIAELDIDVSRLAGNGGADYPHLFWQLEMALQPPKTPLNDYALRSVAAQLYLATGLKITDARPLSLDRVIHGFQTYAGSEYLNFEFPLDARRIESIERHRQGGSMQLRLEVQINFDEYGAVPGHEPSKRPPLWGLNSAHRMTLSETFQVPQSDWITRVLPNMTVLVPCDAIEARKVTLAAAKISTAPLGHRDTLVKISTWDMSSNKF